MCISIRSLIASIARLLSHLCAGGRPIDSLSSLFALFPSATTAPSAEARRSTAPSTAPARLALPLLCRQAERAHQGPEADSRQRRLLTADKCSLSIVQLDSSCRFVTQTKQTSPQSLFPSPWPGPRTRPRARRLVAPGRPHRTCCWAAGRDRWRQTASGGVRPASDGKAAPCPSDPAMRRHRCRR